MPQVIASMVLAIDLQGARATDSVFLASCLFNADLEYPAQQKLAGV